MPETHQFLCSILTSTFRIPEDEIQPQATLEELGLDSLALADLWLVIHERFGVTVTGEHAARSTTITEIVDRLDILRAEDTGAAASS
ncbi:acyl carrier protein [Streptomyces sp. NPDC088560]|uniref:acyl carrier protein n=1 Tax=Streptomyces sp. NPDC088560 TaxID=3365868 RepID=UPI0038145A6D